MSPMILQGGLSIVLSIVVLMAAIYQSKISYMNLVNKVMINPEYLSTAEPTPQKKSLILADVPNVKVRMADVPNVKARMADVPNVKARMADATIVVDISAAVDVDAMVTEEDVMNVRKKLAAGDVAGVGMVEYKEV